MASLKNRALALANLGYQMARQVLVRMPLRAAGVARDKDNFLGAVRPEGFLPLTPSERAAFPRFMECIHCGLCSLACPEIAATPADAWREAWTFVAGPSRSLDEADLVAHEISPCTKCDACAAVCPTGVPIPLLAATLERLRAETRSIA